MKWVEHLTIYLSFYFNAYRKGPDISGEWFVHLLIDPLCDLQLIIEA